MMEQLFLKILNMSITAGYIVLVVLAIRLLLRRAPKRYACLLWAPVFFRLACPVSFASGLSVIGQLTGKAAESGAMTYIPPDITMAQQPAVDVGSVPVNAVINNALPAATPTASANPMQVWLALAAAVWLLGVVVLLGYAAFSYIKLRRRLSTAVLLHDNVYSTDRYAVPFVAGIFAPKIYLPAGMAESAHILRHEQLHIRRGDYLTKPLAFLILTAHWFNPLAWCAYLLLGRDMEMACDERVLEELGGGVRTEYSRSLLSVATRQFGLGIPLAFGESNLKARVKNVLKYNKPARWVLVAAAALCLLTVFSCAADPKSEPQDGVLFGRMVGTNYPTQETDRDKIGLEIFENFMQSCIEEQENEELRAYSYTVKSVTRDMDEEERFSVEIMADFEVASPRFLLAHEPAATGDGRYRCTDCPVYVEVWERDDGRYDYGISLAGDRLPEEEPASYPELAETWGSRFSTTETDRAKIGEIGYAHYMDSFMGEDVPEEYRILSYEVVRAEHYSDSESEFSVQIVSDYTCTGIYWLSANGEFVPQEDGTYACRGDQKFLYIRALGDNNYEIYDIGTGGNFPGVAVDLRTKAKNDLEFTYRPVGVTRGSQNRLYFKNLDVPEFLPYNEGFATYSPDNDSLSVYMKIITGLLYYPDGNGFSSGGPTLEFAVALEDGVLRARSLTPEFAEGYIERLEQTYVKVLEAAADYESMSDARLVEIAQALYQRLQDTPITAQEVREPEMYLNMTSERDLYFANVNFVPEFSRHNEGSASYDPAANQITVGATVITGTSTGAPEGPSVRFTVKLDGNGTLVSRSYEPEPDNPYFNHSREYDGSFQTATDARLVELGKMFYSIILNNGALVFNSDAQATQPLPVSFIWPLANNAGIFNGSLESYPGATGMSIAAPQGTPVVAAADGTVSIAEYNVVWPYGRQVYIKHDGEYDTRYAHLDTVAVRVGDEVRQGAVIGTVGNSGNASGFTLGFEIRQNEQYLDPVEFVGKNEQSAAVTFAWPLPQGVGTYEGSLDAYPGHTGVDIIAARGTEVRAAAAGRVTAAQATPATDGYSGYGRYITIEHEDGRQTRYAHLDSVAVTVGQQVAAGEKIGAVGNSGLATTYHLHFEVLSASGEVLDPLDYLPE